MNAAGEVEELPDHVGNLGELLAPWEIDRMYVGARHGYVIHANWKTITENHHECYAGRPGVAATAGAGAGRGRGLGR